METNGINMQELEQLRSDYALLKERLDKQEIINDRLMASTFSAKVKEIHSVSWVTYLCGLFVLIVAPYSFHYGPLNLSWYFVIATDIMMLVSMYFTWKWHHDLKNPEAGTLSIKEFAQSVKTLKVRYQNWLKISIPMILVWIGWMLAEMYFQMDSLVLTIAMAVALLVGAAFGGILGYSLHRKVVNRCDEIISQTGE